MTSTPIPSWFKLAMLPILAAGLYGVDTAIEIVPGLWIQSHGVDDLVGWFAIAMQFFRPFLDALLLAYPLAALYPRRAALIGFLVSFPDMVLESKGILAGDAWNFFWKFSAIVCMGVFVPALAGLARRTVQGSRLVIIAASEAATEARAFQCLLLLLFACAIGTTYDSLSQYIYRLDTLHLSRLWSRTVLLTTSFLGPALLALAFAFPMARVFGRRAAVATLFLPTPALLWWASDHFSKSHPPFLTAAYVIETISLATLPAIAAGWASRRLRDTRLAIEHAAVH